MESGITIELEQSFASVVRYIQNKADNNAALYFDDLPEAFAVPSLYFPVPRTDTRKVTFSTYLTTLYLDTWFMEATDWQAYADAATVRDSLMMDECKVKQTKTKKRVNNTQKKKTYKIKQGDCLWNIAKRYYGDGKKCAKIYNANKSVLNKAAKKHGYSNCRNGNLIFPGTTITIP